MFLAKVGNSESYKKEAVEAIEKNDNEGMIGQIQIGRSIILENLKLVKGMKAMSEIMVDQLTEIESKELTIKAYESKLGRKLTIDELKNYSVSKHFPLSLEEATNKLLIEKCMSKIK